MKNITVQESTIDIVCWNVADDDVSQRDPQIDYDTQ